MVCFETKPNFVQFCKNCGRYLGCFSCLSNLQDCPQYRKPLHKLNCPTCDSDIQQEMSIVYTGFTNHTRFRRYSATWHNTGPIESMMMLFVYALYRHFAKSAYSHCLIFLLWDRTFVIIILRYHIMKNFVFKFYVADLIGKSNQSYIVSRRVSN